MNFKIALPIIVCLIITSPVILADINTIKKETTKPQLDYLLYEKTVLITGSCRIIDIFDTPPDCSKINIYARVGFYFTGFSEIYIRSIGHNTTENHSIWGTGLFISGRFFLPSIHYFNVNKYAPGKQIVEIVGMGCGIVTYYIKGENTIN